MTSYDIDYNDERFKKVETEKNQALDEVENTYNEMIDKNEEFYQSQKDVQKEWADKQTEIQQEKTDFAIEKTEQEKQQTEKDYQKEQSAAYIDYKKQTDPHGVEAEQMASMGMENSGYSESSRVAMWNSYQNRVASARESYKNAIMNFDNNIKEAQLQNSSILAEIAFKAQQEQLELSIQAFQSGNQLLLDKVNSKLQLNEMYYGREQDVLAQINQENALAEEIRQYNENKAFQEKQLEEQKRQFNASLAEDKRQFNLKQQKQTYSFENDSEFSEDGDYEIDWASVNDLGYGMINEDELARLEKEGLIVSYLEDGKWRFKRDTSKTESYTPAQSQFLSSAGSRQAEISRALRGY